jgi:hypothetical protein
MQREVARESIIETLEMIDKEIEKIKNQKARHDGECDAIINGLEKAKIRYNEILEAMDEPKYRPYTGIELVGRIGLNVKDRDGDSCQIISVTVTKNRVEVELGYEMSIATVSPKILLENYILGSNKDYVSRNDLHLGIKIS